MLKLLLRIPGLIAMAFVLTCTATVGVQLAGIGIAMYGGVFRNDKLLHYAGVLYGVDPLDLTPSKQQREPDAKPETREEILADRVQKTPLLTERTATISKSIDEIRSTTQNLKRNREQYVATRAGFESLLNEEETKAVSQALREVQMTMEVLAPKQAKDILREMLVAPNTDPTDNVMQDVVDMIKALPDDKLRKILAEFKSDDERRLLHQILVQIGDLDDRTSQLSKATQ